MKLNHQTSPTGGFALVVTISMMVLLTMVVVATLSLSTITLRSVDRGSAQQVAKANARLALTLAIAKLQASAGPDQRVTATATLDEENSPNPQWTGVWKTESRSSTPEWLVSGKNPSPQTALNDRNSMILATAPEGETSRRELRAPSVEVDGRQLTGRFAYWVGDEGVKARVDVSAPTRQASENDVMRVARALSPQENGIAMIDRKSMGAFQAGGDIDKSMLASMGTVALAATDGAVTRKNLMRHYFDDLTTGGFGLPVNVKEGGMKADLSLLFDSSQESNSPLLNEYFGGRAGSVKHGENTLTNFSVSDAEKFYVSKQIADHGNSLAGPNWGNLYNYGTLWKKVSNNTMPLVGNYPGPETQLRHENWLPYKGLPGAQYEKDIQHTSSGVVPVLYFAQIGFRLKAEGPFTGTADDPPVGKYYKPVMEVKPVIGLWNPYNVAIRQSTYLFQWAIAPYVRMAYGQGSTTNHVTEIWMREYWNTGNNGGLTLPTEGSRNGGYFNLEATGVDLQPGEFRLFSIDTQQELAKADGKNKLVSTWGEDGGFWFRLKRSETGPEAPAKQGAGTELRIPAGKTVWTGALFLQDTQFDGKDYKGISTVQHFGGKIADTAASTWIGIRGGSGNLHLSRYTNFWSGGSNFEMGKPFMPEPISHSKDSKTERRFPIEMLASRGAFMEAAHLATWRFYSRTSTDLVDQSQGVRGWIDSNPRALASSVRFDGSKAKERTGLNVLSSFIGESHDGKEYGDGAGGNRGLALEGLVGNPEPEGVLNEGRWQGYGGSSSSGFGGVTHSVIYDVPRGPLVSVGQFQHAQLSRYNYEPGFVVGNSYANPRIPLNQIMAQNAFDLDGFNLVDISYDVNDRIWDKYFFSTMSPDYVGASNFDSAFNWKDLVTSKTRLPNPRMVFRARSGDESLAKVIDEAKGRAAEAISSRILISGAFNVNSTSKTAWKAVLSSMGAGLEFPVISASQTPTTSWNTDEGIRFNRFSHALGSGGTFEGGNGSPESFWKGWRKISEEELDDLAEQMVEEVRERGPFRSMGAFVNRDIEGDPEHQRKGAMQAAIDRTVNKPGDRIPEDISQTAVNPKGEDFSQAATDEPQAAGGASYLLQGDVLQSLAPILQVRSDYFRVRTCGEALDRNGRVVAKAWCEAFVQRMPEYVNPSDQAHVPFTELQHRENKEFGRQFEVVSFRWLSPEEI